MYNVQKPHRQFEKQVFSSEFQIEKANEVSRGDRQEEFHLVKSKVSALKRSMNDMTFVAINEYQRVELGNTFPIKEYKERKSRQSRIK